MTIASLDRRLRKLESAQGINMDPEIMTDMQLWHLVRSGYRRLAAQHGGLAQAIIALRATGDPDDISLATLIEEDTGGPDAVRH